jgi:hypothetical protein
MLAALRHTGDAPHEREGRSCGSSTSSRRGEVEPVPGAGAPWQRPSGGARVVHPREPGGHAGVRRELEPARVEQVEQRAQVEALLVFDALAELEQRILGEVAGEAVEPVVECGRARHRQVEGPPGARDARQLVAAGGQLGDVFEHVVADGRRSSSRNGSRARSPRNTAPGRRPAARGNLTSKPASRRSPRRA